MMLAVAQVTSCGVTPCANTSERARIGALERRAQGVALEQLRHRSFSGGHDDEVAVGGVALELRHADLGDLDRAATFGDDLHEPRKLDPLVDRLRGRVEPADEAERLSRPVRCRDRDAHAVDRRRGGVPQIEPEPALFGARRSEHALARQHLAGSNVLPGAVLRKTHLEAGVEQADGEHESGLTAAHDGDVTHDGLSAVARQPRQP